MLNQFLIQYNKEHSQIDEQETLEHYDLTYKSKLNVNEK